MALKNDRSLIFYIEIEETHPPPYLTADFLVGIFDAPDAESILQHVEDMKTWAAKSKLARLFSSKPTLKSANPAAVCKAAAYLQDNGQVLVMKNVGAEIGFGPTLYALVMELARARGRQGVRPSTEPKKILLKPKRIWQQFHDRPEYQGKVLATPVPGSHKEAWLNMVYSLAPDTSLLDYERKRAEWRTYETFWKNLHGPVGWRYMAFDMAQRSVEAHVSKAT